MRLALFDLDNTLLAGDSDHSWGEFVCQRGLVDAEFMLIDDDINVCDAVAERYPMARVIKVPSQCCAYLAASRALSLGAERAL